MKKSIYQKSKISYLFIVLSIVFTLPMIADSHQFLAWDSFDNYRVSGGGKRGKIAYRIPVPLSDFQVKELIPSWNLKSKSECFLDVFIRASFSPGQSHTFHLGHWANGEQCLDKPGPRTSINEQSNDHGVVYTDTLVFKQVPTRCEAILHLDFGDEKNEAKLDFFGLCLSQARALDEAFTPLPITQTRLLNVPRLCQRDYIGGGVWCSPTSVTMIMSYWAEELARSDLRYSVPESANQIFDPGWPGTGNWAFNVAFAGGHSGIRAFVNRLNGLEELKVLVDSGVPVATSVSYDLLKGKSEKGSNDGHLVVVVGFNQAGDPVFNDPAACPDVQLSYPLEHFLRAWQSSRQTVYIVYPSEFKLPEQLKIHWQ